MRREYEARRSNLPTGIARRGRVAQGRKRRGNPFPADLQRQLGNRGSQSWLGLQTKLRVGPPRDRYEREAEAVARRIASGGSSGDVSRVGVAQAPLSQGLEEAVQRERRGGRSLPAEVRAQMEQGFGRDFRDVRIHDDSESHRLNRALQSNAFTSGRDIFFAHGKYRPGNGEPRTLLAHELTHVVQQGPEGIGSPTVQREQRPGAILLTVPLIRQESTNTCWAATTAMLVNLVYGGSGTQAVTPRGVATTAGLQAAYDADRALSRHYDSLRPLAAAWDMTIESGVARTEDQVRAALNGHGPFITIIGYSGTAHAVVVRGITANGGSVSVHLADPGSGYRSVELGALNNPMTMIYLN